MTLDGCRIGSELPQRPIPLDELRIIMLKRKTSWPTKGAVWADLVRRAQDRGEPWITAAIGYGDAHIADSGCTSAPRRYRVTMTGAWHARDVPRAERVYYMRHAVAELMGPLDMTYADKEEDFPGWIRATDIGAVRVIHGSAPRGDFVRTPQLIRRSDPELYGLWMPCRRRWVMEQDGHQAALGPGEFAFVDLSRPFRIAGPMHDFASVLFPRAMLPLDRHETRRLAGVGFSDEQPDAGLVSTVVCRLVRDMDAYNGSGAARIGSAVLELVTAALTARLDRPVTPPGEASHHAQMLRIHTFIEERLGDPALAPAEIAAAHHISVRQLYKLFESKGRTVAGWVRGRRLERCRRDLLDPALCGRPVRAIAARWGFTDPAHFSRAFREVYGVPPGEYRRLSTEHQRLCNRRQGASPVCPSTLTG